MAMCDGIFMFIGDKYYKDECVMRYFKENC